MAAVVSEGFHSNKEYICRRQDGLTFDALVSARLVRGAAGEPAAFLVVTQDISGRKAHERALAESETRFRTVFESANDGVFLVERPRPDGHGQPPGRRDARASGRQAHRTLGGRVPDGRPRRSGLQPLPGAAAGRDGLAGGANRAPGGRRRASGRDPGRAGPRRRRPASGHPVCDPRPDRSASGPSAIKPASPTSSARPWATSSTSSPPPSRCGIPGRPAIRSGWPTWPGPSAPRWGFRPRKSRRSASPASSTTWARHPSRPRS